MQFFHYFRIRLGVNIAYYEIESLYISCKRNYENMYVRTSGVDAAKQSLRECGSAYLKKWDNSRELHNSGLQVGE